MAAHMNYYCNIRADYGYISGLLNAYCECLINDKLNTEKRLDIELVGKDLDPDFIKAFKKRLYKYDQIDEKAYEGPDTCRDLTLNDKFAELRLDLNLDKDLSQGKYAKIVNILNMPKDQDGLESLLAKIQGQLGQLKQAYWLGPLDDKTKKILAGYYSYIIFDAYLLEYKDYWLCLILGSNA